MKRLIALIHKANAIISTICLQESSLYGTH